MFIFQSNFDILSHCDYITEKSENPQKNQWDFQISKVGSLDLLDLKVNGSPVAISMAEKAALCLTWTETLWKVCSHQSPIMVSYLPLISILCT